VRARGALTRMVRMEITRPQTDREERFNALSHGLGLVAAAAAWPLLSDFAAHRGGRFGALGIAVFVLTMMAVYAASTVYHLLPPGRAKRWAHRCDHAAIFLFIAGSYTPFALGPLRDAGGLPLLAGVWALAVFGIACKATGRLQHPWVSTGLYVVMGWCALLVLEPLMRQLGRDAVLLLLAGGAAYSVGVVFFLFDHRLRYGHFVWHLFVLAGSGCHVAAALQPGLA
jgi:hemolysin III